MWCLDTEGKGCGWWIAITIITLAFIFGVTCLEGWIVMLLWNAVVPVIWVGAPKLSFWVAVGVLLLCNILFKAASGGGNKKK